MTPSSRIIAGAIAYRARRLALRWQIPACIAVVLLLTAYAMLAASLAVQSIR